MLGVHEHGVAGRAFSIGRSIVGHPVIANVYTGSRIVTNTGDELENLILTNPLTIACGVLLEELLHDTEPDCVDINCFVVNGTSAEALEHGQSISELIHEYKQSGSHNRTTFGICAGVWIICLRPFSLWLVACVPGRVVCTECGNPNKLHREFDSASLPMEIERVDLHPDAAYETIRGILISFVDTVGQRVTSPPWQTTKLRFEMLATYSSKYTDPNCVNSNPQTHD